MQVALIVLLVSIQSIQPPTGKCFACHVFQENTKLLRAGALIARKANTLQEADNSSVIVATLEPTKKIWAKLLVCPAFPVRTKMNMDPKNVNIVMQECFKKTKEKRRACPVKMVRLPVRGVRFANRVILGSMEVHREDVPPVLSTSTPIHVVPPCAKFVQPEKLPTKIKRVVNCHRGVPAKWANI